MQHPLAIGFVFLNFLLLVVKHLYHSAIYWFGGEEVVDYNGKTISLPFLYNHPKITGEYIGTHCFTVVIIIFARAILIFFFPVEFFVVIVVILCIVHIVVIQRFFFK